MRLCWLTLLLASLVIVFASEQTIGRSPTPSQTQTPTPATLSAQASPSPPAASASASEYTLVWLAIIAALPGILAALGAVYASNRQHNFKQHEENLKKLENKLTKNEGVLYEMCVTLERLSPIIDNPKLRDKHVERVEQLRDELRTYK